MKRVVKRLKKFLARKEVTVAPARSIGVIAIDDDTIEKSTYDIEMAGRTDTHGPETDILMPDIYGDGNVATEPNLEIIDLRSPGDIESAGFNPYDTAVLQEEPDEK